MKWTGWKHRTLRRRVLGIASLLLVLALVAHPELRLLVPLLDAAMLDVLLALFSAQLLVFLGTWVTPFLRLLWQRSAGFMQGVEELIETTPLRRARRAVERLVDGSGSDWNRQAWHYGALWWWRLRRGPEGSRGATALPAA
jgi:hypothetical protein